MGTFIAAYAIAWLALAAYLLRLRAGHRRLERLAQAIQVRVEAGVGWPANARGTDEGDATWPRA